MNKKSNSISETKYVLKSNQKITEDQKREIQNASREPIVYDEECPEYSYEELKEMLRRTKELGKDRRKYGVTMRLDSESIDIAKAYGEGYTTLLARVVYYGIRDPKILKMAIESLT